jgi:hypothetical protein
VADFGGRGVQHRLAGGVTAADVRLGFCWLVTWMAVPWPVPVLDLTRNRVLPNFPHPSLGPGRAGRPGSGSGSAHEEVGFAPPAGHQDVIRRRWRSPPRAGPRDCSPGRVPGDALSDDHEQLWRSSAAAAACLTWSGLEPRLVRAAWWADQTALCGSAPQTTSSARAACRSRPCSGPPRRSRGAGEVTGDSTPGRTVKRLTREGWGDLRC